MSCVHEFSLRMHTLVSNHASPASKLCSQDMRIACSARMCGRPAAAPYPGLRPSAVRQCERGRPAAVHFPGRRRPAAVLHALLYRSFVLKGGGGGLKSRHDEKMKCQSVSHLPTYTQNSRSPIHYVPKDFYYN